MSELPAAGSPFPPGSSEIASAGFLLENCRKQVLTLRYNVFLSRYARTITSPLRYNVFFCFLTRAWMAGFAGLDNFVVSENRYMVV